MSNSHSRLQFFGTLAVLSCLALGVSAQPNTKLLLIRRNNLYGYADSNGKVVIAPRFEDAQQFSEERAAVKVGGKWGYIDEAGNQVVAPQFESADRFSEKLAAVELNQKFGYINQAATFVIPSRYDRARAFFDGLAVVKDGNEWLVINTTGSVVLKPEYDIVESFSGGLAAVKGQGRWGYIDRTGKLVIPLKFERAGSFVGGLAPARLDAGTDVGFIALSGNFSIKPQFREAKPFANGVAAVQTGKSWGFIDTTGKLVIPSRYDQAGYFLRIPDRKISENELAQVTDKIYGRSLYIDGSGRVAFEMSDMVEARVGGYRLVKLEITSSPTGAKVYLIPRDDWDNDPNLIKSDEKLNLYRPREGDTAPITTEVYEQTLIVVYSLNGKRGWKLVDVVGPAKNTVGITPE